MSQIDDRAIDAVLAALRDADPPVGMEIRILDALEGHRSSQPVPATRSSLPARLAGLPRTPLAGALAASLAVASLATAAFLHPARHKSPDTSAPQRTGTQAPQPKPADLASEIHDSHRSPTGAPHSRPSLKIPPTAPPTDLDTLALSESLAPSQPAPPLPLTPQEQLLMRVLHRRDPEPLTDLNGELRAKREAEQLADFDKFFKDPPQPATHDNE